MTTLNVFTPEFDPLGRVNLTSICAIGNKRFVAWHELADTRQFLGIFAEGMVQTLNRPENKDFLRQVQTTLTNASVSRVLTDSVHVGGKLYKKADLQAKVLGLLLAADPNGLHWGHRLVAVNLACWVSPFAAYYVTLALERAFLETACGNLSREHETSRREMAKMHKLLAESTRHLSQAVTNLVPNVSSRFKESIIITRQQANLSYHLYRRQHQSYASLVAGREVVKVYNNIASAQKTSRLIRDYAKTTNARYFVITSTKITLNMHTREEEFIAILDKIIGDERKRVLRELGERSDEGEEASDNDGYDEESDDGDMYME